MTQTHYIQKLKELGFSIMNIEYSGKTYDSEFAECFEEKLGKYPLEDLKIDIMTVHAIK
jgi:hypothetical protein